MQYLLPQHLLSRGAHLLTRSTFAPLKNALIGSFVRHYQPQMHDALEPDPYAYQSFNEFFTRALRYDARPLDRNENTCVSPVDGCISQLGALHDDQILQAKGLHYSLTSLLDEQTEFVDYFRNGSFATIYLAPFNYHRIHLPLNATLRAAWYQPGDLFSVNATTAAHVAGLFARNERIVCIFETDRCRFALIMVGALFVGSMSTIWHGEVTAHRSRQRQILALEHLKAPLQQARGAEIGRFNMGSTVILLFPRDAIRWREPCQPGAPLQMGQALADLP
jgi:phosphatidylserine decarboxylase